MRHEHLPEGWRLAHFGEVLLERNEGGNAEDELLSVTQDRGIISQSQSAKRDNSNADKSRYKRIYPNDIVYNTMRMWQGASALSKLYGIVSPAYTVCIPTEDVLPEYIASVLKLPEQIKVFHRFSQGIVDDTLSLKYPAFAKLTFPLPPIEEQRRIAEVLRDADTNISRVESQIEAAQELKRGAMQRLFTYGLGGEGTPTKHTRIGEIPAHWDVVKVRNVMKIQLGKMLSGASKQGVSPYPYLRNANVQWGFIDISDIKEMDFSANERKKFQLKRGDILVCEGGEIGRTAIWNNELEECYYQKALHRLRPINGSISSEYFAHYMQLIFVARPLSITQGIGSTIAHLTAENLAVFPVALPSIKEQCEIAAILNGHDETIHNLQAEAESLRQIKRGLMKKLLSGEVRI